MNFEIRFLSTPKYLDIDLSWQPFQRQKNCVDLCSNPYFIKDYHDNDSSAFIRHDPWATIVPVLLCTVFLDYTGGKKIL